MQKVTLTTFPFHFLEPIKKLNEIDEIFNLTNEKDEIIEQNEIENLSKKKAELIEKINSLTTTVPSNCLELPEVIEYKNRLKFLHGQRNLSGRSIEAYEARIELEYENHRKSIPEILYQFNELESAKWELDYTNKDLEKVKTILNKIVPETPLPLSEKHIDLINQEIAENFKDGYELESYQLLITEYYREDNYQKCYSGIMFTWRKIK